MHSSWQVCRGCVATLLVASVAIGSGCASSLVPSRRASPQDRRAVLNEGYSLLYDDLSNVAKFDLIFLVKVEADTVQQLAQSVSDYAGVLTATLAGAARDYPALDIELHPLPEMEKRKREAVTHSTLRNLAPIVGLTGARFERRVLQSYEGALNQLQALCGVLAEEEPEPGLRRILTDARRQLQQHGGSVRDMLQERYYVDDRE